MLTDQLLWAGHEDLGMQQGTRQRGLALPPSTGPGDQSIFGEVNPEMFRKHYIG